MAGLTIFQEAQPSPGQLQRFSFPVGFNTIWIRTFIFLFLVHHLFNIATGMSHEIFLSSAPYGQTVQSDQGLPEHQIISIATFKHADFLELFRALRGRVASIRIRI